MTHNEFVASWLLWFAYFIVVEGDALLRHYGEGDTLSELVWAWFSMRNYGTLWRLRRFILLSFMAWLSAHFLTGGKF